MALHMALLEWLIQGSPPDLWTRGCLHQGILPPQGTYTCPYDCLVIAVANLLSKGKARLLPCPPLGGSPIPLVLGADLVETSLHPLHFTGIPVDKGAKENPHPTYDGPDPPTKAARPPHSAQRTPTSRSSLFLCYSLEETSFAACRCRHRRLRGHQPHTSMRGAGTQAAP